MAEYLILDAYNVIGALDRYRAADDLDAARELLVNDALKAAGWTGRTIIVVFDAHRSPEPGRTEPRAGEGACVYSAPGESADDIIERLARRDRTAPTTVCTADFALQRTALARGATRATPASSRSCSTSCRP